MGREDPAEGDVRALRAEGVRGQPNRRRHRRHPIQPVEHPEEREADDRELGVREINQRQPAQAVIEEQQPAIVEAIGEPTGKDGSDEVEYADDRQDAGGADRGDAVIAAKRDPMRLDEAVGAEPADEEGDGQDPKYPAAAGLAQRDQRREQQRLDVRGLRRRGDDRAFAERRQPDDRTAGRASARRRKPAPSAARETTRASAARQPQCCATLASSGRKTNCPVALLAVSIPTTRPRRALNQRVATVAPSTSAVMPVPRPTTTPQNARRCQTSRIAIVPTMPIEISATAKATTARTPKRLMNAAANGPISPNSSNRTASAKEMSAFAQPNSRCSGSRITPDAPIAPAVASMMRNVMATTTQP